jgi:hypothetical protein
MRRGFYSVAVWLGVGALCGGAAVGPPLAYTVSSQAPYSYLDISQSGSQILAGLDDATATINIGFPLKFYGQTYTSLCVSDNGLIAFGGCNEDFANLDFTSQAPPAGKNLPMIAPFWDDLSFAMPGAGAVIYQVLGAAPSRQLVLQWSNVFGLGTPSPLNFQVVLKETANTILFQYKGVDPGVAAVDKGAGATVGIRGIDGHTNGNRAQFSYNAATLRNSMAILFTPPATATATELKSPTILISRSGMTFNRFNNTYSGTITIKNNSAAPIARPITLLLTGLPAGVTVTNAAGIFPGAGAIPAGPYLRAPGSGNLAPGATVSTPVTFAGAAGPTISYTVRVYTGPF